VLLPACPRSEAVAVAEKIRSAINSDTARLGGRGTTASLGVATTPDDAGSPRGLVDAADRALYAAKARGRDRVAQAGDEKKGPGRESSEPPAGEGI